MDEKLTYHEKIQTAAELLKKNHIKANQIIDELLDERPNNRNALNLDFERHHRNNNYERAKRSLERIRADQHPTPEWVDRYLDALEKLEIELNEVVIPIDPILIPSTILLPMARKHYEGDEARISMLKIQNKDRVLELGAGIGYISSLLKKKCPEIGYVCFEAIPNVFKHAMKTHEKNSVSVEIHNAVLGDKTETVDFFVHPVFWGSSLVPIKNAVDKISINQYAVNEVLEKHDSNFVIMDIEGGEGDLIPRMDLTKVNKLMIELHPAHLSNASYSNIFKVLLNQGFHIDASVSKGQVFFFEKPTTD